MARKKDTITQRVTQQKFDDAKEWMDANQIRAKPKYDPDNEAVIIEIKVSAPSDYLIGQLRNKLS